MSYNTEYAAVSAVVGTSVVVPYSTSAVTIIVRGVEYFPIASTLPISLGGPLVEAPTTLAYSASSLCLSASLDFLLTSFYSLFFFFPFFSVLFLSSLSLFFLLSFPFGSIDFPLMPYNGSFSSYTSSSTGTKNVKA